MNADLPHASFASSRTTTLTTTKRNNDVDAHADVRNYSSSSSSSSRSSRNNNSNSNSNSNNNNDDDDDNDDNDDDDTLRSNANINRITRRQRAQVKRAVGGVEKQPAALEATVIEQYQQLQTLNSTTEKPSANQLNKQQQSALGYGEEKEEEEEEEAAASVSARKKQNFRATLNANIATCSNISTTTTTTTAAADGELCDCNICHHQEILAIPLQASDCNQKQSCACLVAARPQVIAIPTTTDQAIDTYNSNSFLFWKFLSNLPKSITQRSKSTTSSTLEPEVAGYLASKQLEHQQQQQQQQQQRQQQQQQQEKQLCFQSQETVMTVTSLNAVAAAGINEQQQQDNKSCIMRQQQQEHQMKPVAPTNLRGQAAPPTVGGDAAAAGQLTQDGQRLIKIVAPPMPLVTRGGTSAPNSTTTRSSNQLNELTQQQQQQQLTHIVPNLSNANAAADLKPQQQQQQTKLSIATTTTTTRSSASSLSSCILSDSSTSEVRLRWSKKMDFLLSIIGFAVDLANIWRFPYLVYKNGGGVFLIPYVIMLIFGGIPLFFLELCLGQFVKKGPITVWNKICPSMKGVGYCSILISWYVSFYYNVLIAWSVYFIYRSLLSIGEKMPWEDCNNSWNSKDACVSISQLKEICSKSNDTLENCRLQTFATVNVTSPASEFFVKELSQIDQSSGLDDMGHLRLELVLCLVVVYLLHYFSLFRGLETSGKVVWVTATAPYMILSILLVRGLFLPGAAMGIEYYLSPKLERLADSQVWIDAAGQVFYSIGVGFGVHLTYASFNSHNNNCYRDCVVTSAVNAATSVYSGLVVFVYLGYMAQNLGIQIDKVANEGYSLVFEVYPEALTTLPFARFWSILFFIMLLTLGIDSAMGGLEAVITGIEDEFKFARRLSRGQLTALVIVSSFLPALVSCTQGGAYTLYWLDIYSAGMSLLFSALFETIGVVYCYGLDKFIANIESMLGKKPHIFYIVCWKYISPLFLVGVIFMSIYTASVPTYRNYKFPMWSVILGWCLAFSSVTAVPIVAIYYWYLHRGKDPSSSPEKSIRKRDRGSSSAASSRHGSSKKSPNHRAVSVTCSGGGGIGGVGSVGKAQRCLTTTTTTVLTTTPQHEHHHQYHSIGDSISCRTGEDML